MTDFSKLCPKAERCACVNSRNCWACYSSGWYPHFERKPKKQRRRPPRRLSRSKSYKLAQKKAEKKLEELRRKEQI